MKKEIAAIRYLLLKSPCSLTDKVSPSGGEDGRSIRPEGTIEKF